MVGLAQERIKKRKKKERGMQAPRRGIKRAIKHKWQKCDNVLRRLAVLGSEEFGGIVGEGDVFVVEGGGYVSIFFAILQYR